jgi:spore photoproduct lyase
VGGAHTTKDIIKMFPIKASKIYIVDGVEEDRFMRDRTRRLENGIQCEGIEYVGDAELNEIVAQKKLSSPKQHGMKADISSIVIFNRFRFDDPPEVVQERRSKFPALFANYGYKFHGYEGFDFGDTGSPAYRKKTGIICQSAWKIHTICGCPFLCAYCYFAWCINIMMNMEEYVDRLDGWLEKAYGQTLYQYDNWSDINCFEPEYGGTKLLVEYFSKRDREYLELYVGKSNNVDFLLDMDHKGKTICCWSLSGRTQSSEIEYKTASIDERILAAKKCQDAGYHVRFRFSPIIPVKNWEEENREMIENLFAHVHPDIITFETLRFRDYNAIINEVDQSLLDPEFLQIMKDAQGEKFLQGCEIPHEFRKKVYKFIIDELERVSPETPYAFCRESKVMWDDLEADFMKHGQSPDYYVCNCGPTSTPGHELLGKNRE